MSNVNHEHQVAIIRCSDAGKALQNSISKDLVVIAKIQDEYFEAEKDLFAIGKKIHSKK